MEASKLFKVLVLGGAMLGLGCVEDPPPADDDAGPDRADAAASPDAGTPGADSGGPVECGFCPNDECCETDESGSSTLRDGMMCCWGTSC